MRLLREYWKIRYGKKMGRIGSPNPHQKSKKRRRQPERRKGTSVCTTKLLKGAMGGRDRAGLLKGRPCMLGKKAQK